MQQLPSTSTRRAWLAITVLGIGSFAIVTTELAPIGLLSAIADDLGQSQGRIGLIVTAYAWIAAVAALLSVMMLSQMPRQPLLTILMLVLGLSSATAAVSSTFPILLGARIFGALAHGAFWAVIGTLAAQLVPARRIGLATSIIFGGVSAASVFGVPLASFIGNIGGWRVAFGVIAVFSLATGIAIAVSMPRVPISPSAGKQALWEVVRNPVFLRIYAATACAITAHFAAFTYIEPFLSTVLNVPPRVLSMLLLTFGVAGLLGNVATGILVDRYLKPIVLISLLLMALCLFGFGRSGTGTGVTLVMTLLAGWGVGVAAVFVGFQTWILRAAGDAALPASAIYVAVFNAAIGIGALLGSTILSLTDLHGLMLIAALALAGSLLPVIALKPPAG